MIGLASEPSAIYGPAQGVLETEEEIISHALFDSLVKYDYANKEIKPNLATDWEWTDDTHLKLTLRDDVTMTDGTPLTADDDHTVTIEFKTKAPDFLTMLSWTGFAIVSEDEVNAAGGLEAVSKNPTQVMLMWLMAFQSVRRQLMRQTML